jgi:hypothetical protein
MIQSNHYNSDLVRAIAENVTVAWQQLMYHTEERHKLVMASMNWYKTAEQVRTRGAILGFLLKKIKGFSCRLRLNST